METTTIKITKEMKDWLSALKVHERQSYDEVIRGLLHDSFNNLKNRDWEKDPPTIRISNKDAKEFGFDKLNEVVEHDD